MYLVKEAREERIACLEAIARDDRRETVKSACTHRKLAPTLQTPLRYSFSYSFSKKLL